MNVYLILGWCDWYNELHYKLVAKTKEIAVKIKERLLSYEDCDYVEITKTKVFESEED